MAEKLNGPGFGARMAMAAGQAPSFDALKQRLVDVAAASAATQDAFRELLSYCEGMRDGNESGDAREAYDDVASKLRGMLDGE